jgi:hypothetical protein
VIRRNRGRPEGPAPTFVEDCGRLDATELLAKSRGCFLGSEPGLYWTLSGVDGSESRTVIIAVARSAQRVGGHRRWWCCPGCGRRCGVLLLHQRTDRLGCRTCLGARYISDYPRRQRRRALMRALVQTLDDDIGLPAVSLLSPRRRGVRRGRRVWARGLRQWSRARRLHSTLLDDLTALRNSAL